MKYIIFILIIAASVPFVAGAQNVDMSTNGQGIQNLKINNIDSSGLVQDVVKIFDKVKGSVPLINTQNIQTPSGSELPAPAATSLSGLTNLWNTANAWCEQHIGISLREIINTVINFMIWIWELIIKLIRAALSYI